MKKNIVNSLFRKKTIEIIKTKINYLGISTKINFYDFLFDRLLICVILFIIFLVTSNIGYIIAPIIVIITYFGLEYVMLDYPIKKRGLNLETESLFFFEVLTLTLESGRNLKSSLELMVKNVDGELSREFKNMLKEVDLGKSLAEGLESMKARIPSDTVNNAILNIRESNIFGNSIIDSLYNQIDYLRDKRVLDVKAEINKLPIKMSVISVLFFIPLLLLIILAPLVLAYLS